MPSIFGRRECAKESHGMEIPLEEEESLISQEGESRERHHSLWTGTSIKVLAIGLVGCCLGLFLLLSGCMPMPRAGGRTEALSTISRSHLEKYAAPSPSATSSVLNVFQVYQPVLTPEGVTDETILGDGAENTTSLASASSGASCQVLLMEHVFAYSYGLPFVGNYTPPNCKFNRVTMNFTVTSQGKQYDRLALMYFGDTEVWRTSTAEPTIDGIRWTYIKDMTEYMSLWNSPQKIIFDLGNLVNNVYTASFNTTLTATFFTSEDTVEPASLIIPISSRNGAANAGSVFTLPTDNATNTVSFPRNANRAVFSVSACGQATEEFWWSNVLQSNIDTFDPVDGTLYGYSPFREVQVLIDGQLAGVQWPFPVIFTGGVVPGLWRPIVGIDAFDLREHEIDITPWLPILCDGAEHTFEIKVIGILDDGRSSGTLSETVGSSWLVTGKVFIWLDDDEASITTGKSPVIHLPAPSITLSQKLGQNSTGANETLEYTTNVYRTLSISSLVTSQHGTIVSTWTQNLAVTNYGLYTAFGAVQQNNQTTTGVDQSTGGVYYRSSYSYPLYANTTVIFLAGGNFTIDADLIRSVDLTVQGTPVFPTGLQPFTDILDSASLVSGFSGSQLSTVMSGTAHYFGAPNEGYSSGFGSTSQEFTFAGLDTNGKVVDTELYSRNVESINSTIVKDEESLIGREFSSYIFPVADVPVTQNVMGVLSPKEAIGRGPGMVKQPLIQGGGSN